MKRIISAFLSVLIIFANTVYADETAFSEIQKCYCESNSRLVICGKNINGIDCLVKMEAFSQSGVSVFTDVSYTGNGGSFIFAPNVALWEDGTYSFVLTDELSNIYRFELSKPFEEALSDVDYTIYENEIWFKNEHEISSDKNCVNVVFNNQKVKQGNISSDLFETEGIPDGISIQVVAKNNNTLAISAYGYTKDAYINQESFNVLLKPGIIISDGAAVDIMINNIDLVPVSIAKKVRYDENSFSFSMKNMTQPSDAQNNFTVSPLRALNADKALEKGIHFDYDEASAKGLSIKGVANAAENTVKFTLDGTATENITKNFEIKNFVLKAKLCQGAEYDSDKINIKVIANTESGYVGGGSGSGTGSTGNTGNAGNTGGSSNNNSNSNNSTTVSGGAGNSILNIITPVQDGKKPIVPDIEVSFSDIENHWARDYIEAIAGKRIVSGVGDGRFLPDQSVTRAEFVKIVVKAFDIEESSLKISFKDVSETDWFYTYISSAVDGGMVERDEIFRPNDPIKREEAAKIISEALIKNISMPMNTISIKNYADYDQISEWAYEYAELTGTFGIMVGDNNGCFQPKKNMTRAEAATIIFRTLDYLSE